MPFVKFVESFLDDGSIVVEVYIGPGEDQPSCGNLTLSLDQWNMLRDEQDGSPVVALTASEWRETESV